MHCIKSSLAVKDGFDTMVYVPFFDDNYSNMKENEPIPTYLMFDEIRLKSEISFNFKNRSMASFVTDLNVPYFLSHTTQIHFKELGD